MKIPKKVRDILDAGGLFVINHSGGKDSQAMAASIAKLGIPAHQVLVVHAELPEVDWPGLREHIERTIPQDWKLIYCRAGKTLLEMVERRFETRPDAPSWPSPQYRQCTSDLKRGPIDKAVRHYLREHPEFRGQVVHCIGIRAQESTSRARAHVVKLNKRESVAGRTVIEWLPIHEYTLEDVKATVAGAGQELHWAYAKGMTRLSCCFCIMASQSDLKTAAKLRPDLLKRYVDLEARTGYTMHPSRQPLAEICA